MKKTILLTLLLISALGFSQSHIREWSTYFGDSSLYITGTTEFKGNLYLVGKTTNSLHTQNMASTGVAQAIYGGGASDGFIAKLNADGQPVWFTYYGGAGDDEIYDIVADTDAIYIVGRTNSEGLASAGVQQAALNGGYDGFLASFNEHGQKLWHTYIGGESEDETLSLVQHNNDIYLYGFTRSQSGISTAGSFQEAIYPTSTGQYFCNFISKYTKTGIRQYSTYYGSVGTGGNESRLYMTGIAVNETGFFVSGWDPNSTDNTYYGTPGTFLPVRPPTPSGTSMSLYISKFSFEGSRIWSTYLSAYSSIMNPVSILPAPGGAEKLVRNLAASPQGVFISGVTLGTGITTPLSFQPSKVIGSAPFIVNFSNDGQRLWGSYLGNPSGNDVGIGENSYERRYPLILKSDNSGNIFVSGATHSHSDINTPNGYQPAKNRYTDCFMAKISSDGTEKLYGTYYGGDENESEGYAVPLSSGNGFYLVGTTVSQALISSTGSYQENFISGGDFTKNTFVAKFVEGTMSVDSKVANTFTLYPNPAKTAFFIKGNFEGSLQIAVFDIMGKKVVEKKLHDLDQQTDISHLQKGIYLVKITETETKNTQTLKLAKL